MAIAKITGPGLAAIAILVFCLWTCIVAERRILRAADLRMARILTDLRRMRDGRNTVPASAPASRQLLSRVTAG